MFYLAGLDISWRTASARRTAAIADTLCEQGRFGQKTGRAVLTIESAALAGCRSGNGGR